MEIREINFEIDSQYEETPTLRCHISIEQFDIS